MIQLTMMQLMKTSELIGKKKRSKLEYRTKFIYFLQLTWLTVTRGNILEIAADEMISQVLGKQSRVG